MNRIKFKLIIFIITIILLLSGSFITLDFARLSILDMYNRLMFTAIMKYIIVILCATLVFVIGKDGLSKNDTRRLTLSYILILLSDVLIAIPNKAYLGIISFGLVQISLIYRNGAGIFKKIKDGRQHIQRSRLLINTILTTILLAIIVADIFCSIQNDSSLLYLMIIYGSLLCLSVWIAAANFITGLFPRKNSMLILTGMIMFLLCDLNVGFSLVLDINTYWVIADSLIWIFYTPALLLIALSGYDFNKT